MGVKLLLVIRGSWGRLWIDDQISPHYTGLWDEGGSSLVEIARRQVFGDADTLSQRKRKSLCCRHLLLRSAKPWKRGSSSRSSVRTTAISGSPMSCRRIVRGCDPHPCALLLVP